MASEQKEDVEKIFEGWKSIGNLDYVSCWYKKAADYMGNYNIRAALVSTNSITQGESVSILWKPLFENCASHSRYFSDELDAQFF